MAIQTLICGVSGCGKTNYLLNLIYNYLYYNKIYIYAKHLIESKYQMLQDFFEEVEANMKEKTTNSVSKGDRVDAAEDFQVAIFSSSKDDIVNVDELDKECQNLVIFDDFVTEADQRLIQDLFIRGRKKNCSLIYLTQLFFNS